MHGNRRSIRNVRRGNLMTHQRSINGQPCFTRRKGDTQLPQEAAIVIEEKLTENLFTWICSRFLASFYPHTGPDELPWADISTSQSLQRSGTILFPRARSSLAPSCNISIQVKLQFLRHPVKFPAYVPLPFQSHFWSLRCPLFPRFSALMCMDLCCLIAQD